MKWHLKIIILLCICFFYKTNAQNLVSNSSFEIFKECPDTSFLGLYPNLDSTWFQFNSADYFNSCDAIDYFGVPVNRFGYQFANSGNAYTGLIPYSSYGFGREYLEIKLTNSLLNQLYYVQFHVSLADTIQYAIENLGALFTDTLFDPFPAPSYNWVTGIPQIENPAGNMLNNKFNWVTVTGSFIASGGENYMTIGNFRNDAQTVKQYLGGTNINTLEAYYYIDDVYVGTSPLSVEEDKKGENFVKVYPNPNNGEYTVELPEENASWKINIMDLQGRIIYEEISDKKKMELKMDLENGLYLIQITNSVSNETITKKIIVQK
jgi:OmpA-OmpF porin, OOP family